MGFPRTANPRHSIIAVSFTTSPGPMAHSTFVVTDLHLFASRIDPSSDFKQQQLCFHTGRAPGFKKQLAYQSFARFVTSPAFTVLGQIESS